MLSTAICRLFKLTQIDNLCAQTRRKISSMGWRTGRRAGAWLEARPGTARHVLFVASMLLFMLAPPLVSGRGQETGQADVNLVLGIDCSYSVDAVEFDLQVQGLARAFRSPEVLDAIARGPHGRITVSVVQWSGAANQTLSMDWSSIFDTASALKFSNRLAAMRRQSAIGATSISAMMRFGIALLARAPQRSLRQVIDISADGRNNVGGYPGPVRDFAAARKITINGLAILNEVRTLDKYFELYVTGGPGNFVVAANDYQAFGEAIQRKLIMEILGAALS